jgi:hypothetical protein
MAVTKHEDNMLITVVKMWFEQGLPLVKTRLQENPPSPSH